MSRPSRLLFLSLLAVSILAGAVFALSAAGAGDQAPQTGGDGSTTEVPVAESLPCTGADQATNFQAFSAGGDPLGLPLMGTLRRCDTATEKGEPGANYVSYIYGACTYRIPESSDLGCAPPLEVQTWPACQRSLSDYTYEGQALPYEPLPEERGAAVVDFEGGLRLEVYSGSSTVVIFANDPAVARKGAVVAATPANRIFARVPSGRT